MKRIGEPIVCQSCKTVLGYVQEEPVLEELARISYALYTPAPTTSREDFHHRAWPSLHKSHRRRWKGYVQAVLCGLQELEPEKRAKILDALKLGPHSTQRLLEGAK